MITKWLTVGILAGAGSGVVVETRKRASRAGHGGPVAYRSGVPDMARPATAERPRVAAQGPIARSNAQGPGGVR